MYVQAYIQPSQLIKIIGCRFQVMRKRLVNKPRAESASQLTFTFGAAYPPCRFRSKNRTPRRCTPRFILSWIYQSLSSNLISRRCDGVRHPIHELEPSASRSASPFPHPGRAQQRVPLHIRDRTSLRPSVPAHRALPSARLPAMDPLSSASNAAAMVVPAAARPAAGRHHGHDPLLPPLPDCVCVSISAALLSICCVQHMPGPRSATPVRRNR
jgi:hypothetical protein